MLSLFRCATLADYTESYNVNFWGCDVYDAGVYRPMVNGTFADDDGDRGGGACPEVSYFETQLGRFAAWECVAPRARPVEATVFFFAYTILTAFVVISLFVGVITTAMFETLEAQRVLTEKKEYEKGLARNEGAGHRAVRDTADPNSNDVLRGLLEEAIVRVMQCNITNAT